MEDGLIEANEVQSAMNLIENKENDPILSKSLGMYHINEMYDLAEF